MSAIWIGIDTGGTFTDLVAYEPRRGRYHYHKVPSTAEDPGRGVLEGIAELLERDELERAVVAFLVLGTTLATNAVLERKWAKTGVVTNRGFRDVLELSRQRRPHHFDLDVPKPQPPASRDCRLEVGGRIQYDGVEIEPLEEAALERAAARLRASGVEAVAICFLHSYANPSHEARARALFERAWPGCYLCTSSEVLPEFREFERFATTVVNASLLPVMDRYLERFERGVAGLGIGCAPRVMQSNGGAVSAAGVRRLPINTFFSGPAGGVIGAAAAGAAGGIAQLISFDMGGTSTDVCLVREGGAAMKSVREMGGFPVRTRALDIHTIGAGGGSIAWVDAGGLLKVGPHSAGAHPGPAAYGRGGTAPTVTDANLVLGRLNSRALLGGRLPVHAQAAREAIERALARPLGLDPIEAAAGVLEIVNVNMMGAVRVISVEQGEDPREFTLVAFGGAGPLHAAEVARALGMRRVLVPPHPGLLSALGLLGAEVRGDFSLTRLLRAEPASLAALNEALAALQARAEHFLREEREEPRRARLEWLADLRYVGQNFELILELGAPRLDARSLERLVHAFHHRHQDSYGYDLPGQPVEIVNLRVAVRVPRRAPAPERLRARRAPLRQALLERRAVWFAETGFVTAPVYARERLPAGARIAGPAIVEQMDATTVLPPGAQARLDRSGCLQVAVEPARSGRSLPWAAP